MLDSEDRMHGTDRYGAGITVRAHMALEITKALIINPTIAERQNQDLVKEVSLTKLAVEIADKLLEALDG